LRRPSEPDRRASTRAGTMATGACPSVAMPSRMGVPPGPGLTGQGRWLCSHDRPRAMSIRTLAPLRRFLGAKLGANDHRRQATTGHIQPLSLQRNGTSGHIWHRTATFRKCLLSSRSRVRVAVGAQVRGLQPRRTGRLRAKLGAKVLRSRLCPRAKPGAVATAKTASTWTLHGTDIRAPSPSDLAPMASGSDAQCPERPNKRSGPSSRRTRN
jgi:hypothetical protein